jgi:hypothetical protein
MTFLFKHAWLLFILATFANGVVWWVRSRPHRLADPSLAEGYRSLIRGFVIWANLPWLVMGTGIAIGGVPSVFHYFRPREGGPFVHAWYASLVFVLLAGTHWVFRLGGAEILVRYPGLSNIPLTSPGLVRTLWLLVVLGSLFFYTLLYLGVLPIPLYVPPAA